MSRRKSKGLFSSLDSGRKKSRKKGGSLSSAFGAGKRKGKKSKGLMAAFETKKRRGKKEKGLFAAFDEKPKRREKSGSLAKLFSHLFGWGDTYVELDDHPGYENMRQFLESHDMSTRDRNGILYYLMHFDGQSDVKRALADIAGRGFQMTRNANGAYQQWYKYQSDQNFRELVGTMGNQGNYLKPVTALVHSYFNNGVPRGVFYYLQDKLESVEKVLKTDGEP